MIMVNYNDSDYVHWGYLSHYTRGISVIDDGIERLVNAVEADEHYRDNTIFVIVPDCGRDSNPYAAVPCQHHFNSKSSHEIFALFLGPGIAKGVVVDKVVDQAQIAATIGRLAGMETAQSEGAVLEQVFA
jgi:phosphoglycerol transferase MdoB-like AlkP superfamily enzyme